MFSMNARKSQSATRRVWEAFLVARTHQARLLLSKRSR